MLIVLLLNKHGSWMGYPVWIGLMVDIYIAKNYKLLTLSWSKIQSSPSTLTSFNSAL